MRLFHTQNYRVARFCALIILVAILMPISVQAHGFNLDSDELIKGIAIALFLYLLARMSYSLFASSEEAPPGHCEEDLEYLARIIHGEARGEPFRGQVAVGAVVINRVHDARFPNTIREVIMARNQFTAVTDGQFYLEPSDTSFRAAREALAGADPTGGALYFYNPATARNMEWFRTLRTLVQIGNHVFATNP